MFLLQKILHFVPLFCDIYSVLNMWMFVLQSARLQRLSNSREGRVLSPRLPPVRQKKKTKRCYVCSKKTGLATSYTCRWVPLDRNKFLS